MCVGKARICMMRTYFLLEVKTQHVHTHTHIHSHTLLGAVLILQNHVRGKLLSYTKLLPKMARCTQKLTSEFAALSHRHLYMIGNMLAATYYSS